MVSVERSPVTAKERDPLAKQALVCRFLFAAGSVESSLRYISINFWDLPTLSGQIMIVVLEFGFCFRIVGRNP